MALLKEVLLSFIPLFVAIDVIGVLPIFAGLTEGLAPKEKRTVIVESLWTALSLAVGFIIFGKMIFRFLGITIGDFMIAGGVILFCLGVYDLVNPTKQRRMPSESLGAVPIGTPLIVGPAVLTTSLMLLDQHGFIITLAAVLLNIALVGVVFSCSDGLYRALGESGARALSKVFSLFLSAIAVMMIRRGIENILAIAV